MKGERLGALSAALFLGGVIASVPLVRAAMTPTPGAAMAHAANEFLSALTPEQRKKATFSFEDKNRQEWFFVPIARVGVRIKDLSADQRALAYAFFKTGVSKAGYAKATQIMALEKVLAELEKNPVKRDPELYYFSVFGTPTAGGSWGWRMEGHHLSFNFTVVRGTMVATSPVFMGANPGEVREGSLKGRRVLRAEEDLGRQLVTALDEKQRAQAIYDGTAPAEILTTNASKVGPLPTAGILASALKPAQLAIFRKLLDEFAASLPAPLAKERLARVNRSGLDEIRFAWAGGIARGEPHYYRIQGPTFVAEYDNTQNGANHVHTAWRDFDGDFGRDLLREHLESAHLQKK